MKNFLVLFLFSFLLTGAQAQKYATRSGFTGFYSKTPLEDIKAENKQTYAVIDATNKKILFALLVKGFAFPKQLMQDHFNENYIESDKYPKASFSGSYTGDVDLARNGTYPVAVKGQLTLHGITKAIELPALLEVNGGKLTGRAVFSVKPSDYAISIPPMVREKIASSIEVHLLAECTELK